jgi:hypothetical protein
MSNQSSSSGISAPLLKFGPGNREGSHEVTFIERMRLLLSYMRDGEAAKVCTRLGKTKLVSWPREEGGPAVQKVSVVVRKGE